MRKYLFKKLLRPTFKEFKMWAFNGPNSLFAPSLVVLFIRSKSAKDKKSFPFQNLNVSPSILQEVRPRSTHVISINGPLQ